jgi:hypothetical protein
MSEEMLDRYVLRYKALPLQENSPAETIRRDEASLRD